MHGEEGFVIILQLNRSHVGRVGILNRGLSKWEWWSSQLSWPNEQTPRCPLSIYLIIYWTQEVHDDNGPFKSTIMSQGLMFTMQ